MNRKNDKRERVDSLIDHLWKNGYLTLSRKYGRYLPSPPPIGQFEVDAIAKYKKKIAIGLTISEEDINDPRLISKIEYIITKHPNYQSGRITLFLGVPAQYTLKLEMLISTLGEEIRRNIKIVSVSGNA